MTGILRRHYRSDSSNWSSAVHRASICSSRYLLSELSFALPSECKSCESQARSNSVLNWVGDYRYEVRSSEGWLKALSGHENVKQLQEDFVWGFDAEYVQYFWRSFWGVWVSRLGFDSKMVSENGVQEVLSKSFVLADIQSRLGQYCENRRENRQTVCRSYSQKLTSNLVLHKFNFWNHLLLGSCHSNVTKCKFPHLSMVKVCVLHN